MAEIHDIRRERLRELIADVAHGNQAAFAAMIGKSRAYVGFWLTDPAKGHAKKMSPESAREIEDEMRRRGHAKYLDGWLDNFAGVNAQSQPLKLDAKIMGLAEGMVRMVEFKRGAPLSQEERGAELARFYELLASQVQTHALHDAFESSVGRGDGEREKGSGVSGE